MHPAVVIDWGPLQFATSAYRLALVTAAIVAVLGTILVALRRGAPRWRVVGTVIVAAIGAVVGSRLLGALNTGTGVFDRSFSAFSIWGAIAGGIVAGLVVWRLSPNTVPAALLLDAAAVPAGLAIGVARTGCMCAGCCFGLPTHVPWGVTYPSGSNAHVANLESSGLLDSLFSGPPPVHPVPVYDAVAAVVASGVAIWVYRRYVKTGRLRAGASGMAFLAVYASGRAIIELFRYHNPDPGLLSATGWQFVFATVALAGFAGLTLLRRPGLGLPMPSYRH